MKRTLLLSVLLRGVGLALGGALLGYGRFVRHSDDAYVEVAIDHSVREHSLDHSSKAELGGNLLDLSFDLIGGSLTVLAVIVILLAVFPWELATRKKS